MVDGMFMTGGEGALSAEILRFAEQGRAGLNAAVIASVEPVKADFRAVLTRAEHSKGSPTPAAPGGPPARVSGTLAGSVEASPPRFLPQGVVVRVATTAVYARFLQNGWLPHGRGSRDQRGTRRNHTTRKFNEANHGHQKVTYPFLDEVQRAAEETLGAAAESIRFEF